MEHLPPTYELSRRKLLLGAAGLLASGLVVGGVGGAAFERASEEPTEKPEVFPLKPEHGDAEANLTIAWLPPTVSRWKQQIEKYSNQYDIDPNLVAIMMTVESGGDPNASSGVASGLMQITADRAEDIAGKFLQEKRQDYSLTDPDTNVEFGVANIQQLIKIFGNPDQGPTWDKTVGLVAAGYNGGEGAANDYFKGGLSGLQSQETYSYVRYVTTMWRERHDDRSFAYRYWHDQANGQALVQNAEKYVKP